MDPDPYWSPASTSGSGSVKNKYGSETLSVTLLLQIRIHINFQIRVSRYGTESSSASSWEIPETFRFISIRAVKLSYWLTPRNCNPGYQDLHFPCFKWRLVTLCDNSFRHMLPVFRIRNELRIQVSLIYHGFEVWKVEYLHTFQIRTGAVIDWPPGLRSVILGVWIRWPGRKEHNTESYKKKYSYDPYLHGIPGHDLPVVKHALGEGLSAGVGPQVSCETLKKKKHFKYSKKRNYGGWGVVGGVKGFIWFLVTNPLLQHWKSGRPHPMYLIWCNRTRIPILPF